MSPELVKRPPPSEQFLSKDFDQMTSISSEFFDAQIFHPGDIVEPAHFPVILTNRMVFMMYYVKTLKRRHQKFVTNWIH